MERTTSGSMERTRMSERARQPKRENKRPSKPKEQTSG
jgi:hypothetical protein